MLECSLKTHPQPAAAVPDSMKPTLVPTAKRLPALLLLLILCLAAGCAVLSPPAPTFQAPVELTTPTPPPTRRPSPTPRRILSPTPRPTSTITPTASATIDPLWITATPDAPPDETLDPALLTRVAAEQTATLAPGETLLGRSADGRRLVAHQFGRGRRIILLVGGIHGGWEGNTVALVDALIAHFSAAPEAVAPGIALVMLPALNPDGLVLGRTPEGRFNGAGVDLNRNWGCDWEPDGVWRDQEVDPGAMPFSEPESAALADYVLLNTPAAVIFYHSAANGVFAGACEGDHGSQALGHVYGRAATYPSDGPFTAYSVTGDASNWVDGQGIPAITVELQSWTDPEVARNLAGVMAVQCELARRGTEPGASAWIAANCVAAGS
jgi:hypothetical protein